ncbi:hypothetical protein EDB83DRAFT_2321502 [Lactarius deliciosus]|nr:hypothetical protein EDB83DRAFT_2321502 [Lactarius deliciosus]
MGILQDKNSQKEQKQLHAAQFGHTCEASSSVVHERKKFEQKKCAGVAVVLEHRIESKFCRHAELQTNDAPKRYHFLRIGYLLHSRVVGRSRDGAICEFPVNGLPGTRRLPTTTPTTHTLPTSNINTMLLQVLLYLIQAAWGRVERELVRPSEAWLRRQGMSVEIVIHTRIIVFAQGRQNPFQPLAQPMVRHDFHHSWANQRRCRPTRKISSESHGPTDVGSELQNVKMTP